MHTRAHARAHANAHANAHTCTHMQAHTHARRAHARTHARLHMRARAHTACAHPSTHARLLKRVGGAARAPFSLVLACPRPVSFARRRACGPPYPSRPHRRAPSVSARPSLSAARISPTPWRRVLQQAGGFSFAACPPRRIPLSSLSLSLARGLPGSPAPCAAAGAAGGGGLLGGGGGQEPPAPHAPLLLPGPRLLHSGVCV